MSFEWNRSEVLALAKEACTQCQGFGLRRTKSGPASPCHCVLRSVFRACYRRFRHCASAEKYISRVRLEQVHGKDTRQTWGMKNEEFMVDFCKIAQRTLTEWEHQIFRFHFLMGADWKLCCRRLNTDRGTFFHAVYRIQQKLGRAYREVEPYSLFPLDEYFGGTARTGASAVSKKDNVVSMPFPQTQARWKPPVRKVA